MLLQGQVRPRPPIGRSQARPSVAPLDPLTAATQRFEPLPKPLGTPPYHLDLETVVPGITVEAASLGQLVFHCVGDTGGVKSPQFQASVADAMKADLLLTDDVRPRFFYHLGDVVYYNGQITDYYSQFYEPYDHYSPPILGIPGNHDGDPINMTQVSLDGWVRYFMQPAPVVQPESKDAPRVTLSLPNVYFTLDCPFVTIVGMYTNVPEGGSVDSIQQQWLTNELATAPMDKALIVAMHHPIFSFDNYHSGSAAMGKLLQQAINDSRRVPNMVLAAHVHNFQVIEKQVVPVSGVVEQQTTPVPAKHATHAPAKHARKTKPTPGKGSAAATGVTPFIVCGHGGYYNLHSITTAVGTTDPATGAHLIYEEHRHHGYMTLTVTAETISGVMTTVANAGETGALPANSFSYPATAVTLPAGVMVSL